MSINSKASLVFSGDVGSNTDSKTGAGFSIVIGSWIVSKIEYKIKANNYSQD